MTFFDSVNYYKEVLRINSFSFEEKPLTEPCMKEKNYPAPFATQSEAGKFPLRHRDWVSRLTEGTPRPLTKVAG